MKRTEAVFGILSVSNGKYDIDKIIFIKTKPNQASCHQILHIQTQLLLAVPDDGSLGVFFLLSLPRGCFSFLSIILHPILGDCVGGSNL